MKNLACIFGRHSWMIHDEHGEVYEVCSRCGKLPLHRRSGAEGFGKNFADEPAISESVASAGHVDPGGIGGF
jgi:hypothetical protein